MTSRTLLLSLIAFEALVCAWLFVIGISAQWSADGISRDIGGIYAMAAMGVFCLFVLPAFLLWRHNKHAVLAAILTLIPLVSIITVIERVIIGSEWHISWFVWRQAPWYR